MGFTNHVGFERNDCVHDVEKILFAETRVGSQTTREAIVHAGIFKRHVFAPDAVLEDNVDRFVVGHRAPEAG